MRKFIFWFDLFAICLIVFSSAFAEKPHYTIKRATERILIDGVLDEQDWEAALPVGKFHFRADQDSTPIEQTEVKLLWDDEFLYIAFKCEDSQVTASHFDSNSRVSQDDCVEFFWIPGVPDTLFYQFEINATGTPLAQFRHRRTSSGTRIYLMPPYIAQTIQGTVNDNSDVDTGYTMEIGLRFSEYPMLPYIETITDLTAFLDTMYTAYPRQGPNPGDTWRANLNRINVVEGRRITSSWSPIIFGVPGGYTNYSFHTPECFGYLHFSGEPVR